MSQRGHRRKEEVLHSKCLHSCLAQSKTSYLSSGLHSPSERFHLSFFHSNMCIIYNLHCIKYVSSTQCIFFWTFKIFKNFRLHLKKKNNWASKGRFNFDSWLTSVSCYRSGKQSLCYFYVLLHSRISNSQ